jgi:xylan 1,4-beta-xylosidase
MKFQYLIISSIIAFLLVPACAALSEGEIQITPSLQIGEIVPLLGVNAGPAPIGDPRNPDLTLAYQEIGVRSVRTHDIYNAHSMSILYPDASCDPGDRRCYNFTTSDATFAALVNGGFSPYFRIGDGYDRVHPPDIEEQENWSEAAVNILRHYREGLWDGFYSDITYVEIGNEPDNVHFWPKPHTKEEFFRLYEKTATKLKQAFPDLLVGGPGVTPAGVKTDFGRSYLRSFLLYMKEHEVPVDFLSWHMYSNNPQDYKNGGIFIDSLLAAYGFTDSENHLTEYNSEVDKGEKGGKTLALRAGSEGAAVLTAAWITLQSSGVDQAFVYRGNDPSITFPEFFGIFYADGRPKKIAQAFSLWSEISAYSQQVRATINGDIQNIYAIAGLQKNGTVKVLISNMNSHPVSLSLHGGEGIGITGGLLVSDKSTDTVPLQIVGDTVEMPGFSVVLITMDHISGPVPS